MKKLLALVLLLCSAAGSFAQYVMKNGSESNVCSGTFSMAKNCKSGPTFVYCNDLSYIYTFCPEAGKSIVFDFPASFNIHPSDFLCVYDGPDTTYPSLGCYNNNLSLANTRVQATDGNTSGCLTFYFVSDVANIGTGWVDAAISCRYLCQDVIANLASSTPAASGGYIDICLGDPISLTGGADYPEDLLRYDQDDASSDFYWEFGDGSSATGQTVNHTYPLQNGYTIRLMVTDTNGCKSTNAVETKVRVSKTPIFSPTAALDDSLCSGESTTIPGRVTADTGYFLPITVVSEQLNLPDGSGVCYQTSVTMTDFAAGQTLGDANLMSIFAEMEHSYAGDLQISIFCPSGESVVLVPYPNGMANTEIGCATTSAGAPGPGSTYTWSLGNTYDWQTAPVGTAGCPNGQSNNLPGGTYNSVGDLNTLNTCQLNGDWTIQICDNLAGDNGTLFEWGINFDVSLYPALETYLNTYDLALTAWDADPDIIATSGDTITVQPADTGIHNYTFRVTDNYGCAYDTTVAVYVGGATVNAGADDTVLCTSPSPLTFPSTQFAGSYSNADTLQINTTTSSLSSGAINIAIPDADATGITNTLTSAVACKVKNVCVNITHTWNADVSIYLQDPCGTEILLSDGNGGSGDNYTNVCFDRTSATNITATAGVNTNITGNYLPETALTNCEMTGNWRIRVADVTMFATGTLNDWSITMECVDTTVVAPTILWSPGTDLSATNILDPTYSPTAEGIYTYTLSVTDLVCTATDDVTFNVMCILPISLLSFDAVRREDEVLLTWETASEINNDYFTIERTSDGENFEPVGKIKGAGNSNKVLSYKMVDKNPLGGTSYYRLRQTDFDGNYEYSDLVPVEFMRKEEQLNVFPNPANNRLEFIFISGSDSESILKIFDATGKLVHDQSTFITKGPNNLNLNISGFAAGIYHAVLVSNGAVLKARFVKN